MKKFARILIIALCLATAFSVAAAAIVPYTSYTYDLERWMLESPHAYVPDRVIDSKFMGLVTPLNDPTDMFIDDTGNVYIADAKNNRIVICDGNYKPFMFLDTFVNSEGVLDELTTPSGIFVNEKYIYVADTDNYRIVVFERNTGKFVRIFEEPKGDVFPENHIYKPVALAVDHADRMYVIGANTHYGVIALNSDGVFTGFLGAQTASLNAWEIFWMMIQTKEQKANQKSVVPTEYNNITIDQSGFIYVTTNTVDEGALISAIEGKSKAGTYMPVKMLNPKGDDVMTRSGFYPPAGELLWFFANTNGQSAGVSSIIDVALGPDGMWSIVDSNRQKIYTYDHDGKLLFVFGEKGTQIGQLQSVSSICYKGTDLLAMDKTTDSITVYKRTDYGDFIAAALQNNTERNYNSAVDYWKELLQRNANFDQAYIGIGDSLYREGKYQEAFEYYEVTYSVQKCSDSFKNIRKQWIEKYILIIPAVIILVVLLLSKFFKYANKVNKAGQVMKEKRTLKEAVLYGFHVIFHPFDGFWDLKHEKRGNLKGAIFIIAFTVVAFIYQGLGKAFIFSPYNQGINFFGEILSVLTPYFLWSLANWCLTTLFDGEGSFKDICIATAYSMLPLPLMIIPATLLTNVITIEEASLVNLFVQIAYIWMGFLLFFGMMVTHDYSLSKNILTSLGTLVGMAFIMFVGVLFSGLLAKLFQFFYNIYVELSYRM